MGKDVPREGTGQVKGSGGRKHEEPKDMRGAQRKLGWHGPGLDCAGPLRALEGFGKSLKDCERSLIFIRSRWLQYEDCRGVGV